MQAQMLIALSAGSLKGLLTRPKNPLKVPDLPLWVREELDIRGLSLPTDLLKGCTPADMERIRDAGDRAGCPCLMLVETSPLDIVGSDRVQAQSLQRIRRLAAAANHLGAARLGVKLHGVETPEQMERAARGVRAALTEMDRWEVNLLMEPHGGLLARGDPLVDLVKKVGGFRIGVLPSFQHAHASGDLRDMLRRLAPYAQAMVAHVQGFDARGSHQGWSLEQCVDVLRAVGYSNLLSLEYIGKGDGVASLTKARDVLGESLKAVEALAEDGAVEESEEEAA
jgi:sugar phosphate isomerase/epimerase